MKIIAVGYEKEILSDVISAIREASPANDVTGFESAKDALAFMEKKECRIAFIPTETAEMSGLELAEAAQKIAGNINIIFYSDSDRDCFAALNIHASGYILSPVDTEKVKRELENLRYPIDITPRIRVQAFGNFEAYIDGRPLNFRYSKTKELFAYLIDRRGALCTNREVISAIFEDNDEHDNYLRLLRKDLTDTLSGAGCADVMVHRRGRQGIAADKIECDYYNWLKEKGLDSEWQGEYMSQYTWGEYTAGLLGRLTHKDKSS